MQAGRHRFQRSERVRCPACHAMADAATNVLSRGGPQAGSLGVCADCTVMLVFTDARGAKRIMLQEEFDALPAETRELLRRTVEFFRKPRGGRT